MEERNKLFGRFSLDSGFEPVLEWRGLALLGLGTGILRCWTLLNNLHWSSLGHDDEQLFGFLIAHPDTTVAGSLADGLRLVGTMYAQA